MVSRKKQLVYSFAMLVGAIAVTTLLYFNRPPTAITEPVAELVSVDVAEAVKEKLRIPVQAQGTVTPLQETAILSEVNGRIIEVSPAFTVGGFVDKDEILLRIDPRDYETNLLRAEAAVKSAESALAQEQGAAQVAAREWQKLPKGSQRSQAAKDLYLRKPQLAQAQAQMLAAQADLNTAADNLERTIIRAPYAALIRTKHSELGQFVAAGSPLADIFSIDSAEIRLPIPQNKLDYLDLPELSGTDDGSVIDLYTDVGGKINHWTARLHRTEGVFDERSRVLYAVARINDPYSLQHPGKEPLRIGTFVKANIAGRELSDIIVLPRHVMRAGNFLWVVDENNHLSNRKVTLLRAGGDLVYVSAGLNNGEKVALTTLDNSFDRVKVQVESSTPTTVLGRSDSPDASAEAGRGTTTAAVQPDKKSSTDG